MRVKRDRQTATDIAEILKALEIKDKICARFGPSCGKCPLSKLGALDTDTCCEIDSLAKRLELAYKVVETL